MNWRKPKLKCKAKKQGQGGARGPTGPTGPGMTGTRGADGPTGTPGITGSPGSGLSLIDVADFGPTSPPTYTVPAGSTLLHIKIWGAGGGGAGSAGFNACVGGGGGGGGYAEAYLENPLRAVYPFFLSSGGLGGTGNQGGTTAGLSWFGNPAWVFARGGEGGNIQSTGFVGDTLAPAYVAVPGGHGGSSGGTLTCLTTQGSQGETGFGLLGFGVSGAQGGAAATASGNSPMVAVVPGNSANGQNGSPFSGNIWIIFP